MIDYNARLIETMLNDAADIARSQEELVGNTRFGCIIAHRKKILATGTNHYKSHPVQARFSPRRHAIHMHSETNAIVNYIRNGHSIDLLSKCTMYIARTTCDGNVALAKPCTGCQRAIVEYGIGDVYWTTNGE